ncbi:MAG: hypothetical protein EBR09_14150 [Proteobacteria bacterium]|nr:hypothetical protein [Pseudomonadota bacterium]
MNTLRKILFATVCLPLFGALGAAAAPSKPVSKKKGIGLSESRGFSEKQLKELGVSWYYNWGAKTEIKTEISFVPMIFSKRTVESAVSADVVLGFNEPDNSKQSDMTVQEALGLWPKVVKKGQRIGSPAMAGHPVTGDWLPQFMKAAPKVDFVTVHWYKGIQSKKFKKDMQDVYDTYKKPLWITEFAPQTTKSSRENPAKFSQTEVDNFIREVLAWMENTPFVEKYAWHDAKAGTSALFDEKGNLTASGRTYSSSGK